MTGLWLVSYIALWGLVLLNLLLTLALARRVARVKIFELPDTLKIGTPAPYMRARTLQGEEVTLETFRGNRVAFVFVHPDCEPCREMMPGLERSKSAAQLLGTELVLVGDADATAMEHFAKTFAVSLPILIAPRKENTFLADYKVPGTPFFCLIDEQGNVNAADFVDPEAEKLAIQFRLSLKGGDLNTPTDRKV